MSDYSCVHGIYYGDFCSSCNRESIIDNKRYKLESEINAKIQRCLNTDKQIISAKSKLENLIKLKTIKYKKIVLEKEKNIKEQIEKLKIELNSL